MNMRNDYKFVVPNMPDWIMFPEPVYRLDRDSLVQRISVPVGDLSEAEAEEYAQMLKEKFMKHWEIKRLAIK